MFLSDSDHLDDPEYQPTLPTTANTLLDGWKKGQARLNVLWRSWRDEYLLSLREIGTRLRQPRSTVPVQPSVGDVVLIKDDLPRGCWKLGRVIGIHPSSDSEVRSATVTTAEKKILKRSVTQLYPIELGLPSDADKMPTLADTDSALPSQTRPCRAAAIRQRNDLQRMVADGSV